jgi:two-component system, response regulator
MKTRLFFCPPVNSRLAEVTHRAAEPGRRTCLPSPSLISLTPITNMKLLDLLMVEDDQNDCVLFGIAVHKTHLNICLQIVTDGEQAIDYLEGRGIYIDRGLHPLPGLVVMDLDMRLTGGLEFLDWRRASALFSTLPVVIFSGFTYKDAIETALAMGAKTFIAKPVEFEGWQAVVRQIWDLGMEGGEPMKPALGLASDGPTPKPRFESPVRD